MELCDRVSAPLLVRPLLRRRPRRAEHQGHLARVPILLPRAIRSQENVVTTIFADIRFVAITVCKRLPRHERDGDRSVRTSFHVRSGTSFISGTRSSSGMDTFSDHSVFSTTTASEHSSDASLVVRCDKRRGQQHGFRAPASSLSHSGVCVWTEGDGRGRLPAAHRSTVPDCQQYCDVISPRALDRTASSIEGRHQRRSNGRESRHEGLAQLFTCFLRKGGATSSRRSPFGEGCRLDSGSLDSPNAWIRSLLCAGN